MKPMCKQTLFQSYLFHFQPSNLYKDICFENKVGSSKFIWSTASNKEYLKISPYKKIYYTPQHRRTPTKFT